MGVSWQAYEASPDSTAIGDIRVSESLTVEYLEIERELLAHLPPGYTDGDESYPVVYAHDGRNLFDEAASYDSEWEIDETMERLSTERVEAIVVGIPNADERRQEEYSPFVDPDRIPADRDNPYEEIDPQGDASADWLVETVIPAVEGQFRTTGKRSLFGSSLGGLISLYAFFRDPDRFAFVGAMSPAVGGPWQEIFECIEAAGHVDGRIYVDVGGEEFPDNSDRSAEFESGARLLVEVLESVGYEEKLRFVTTPTRSTTRMLGPSGSPMRSAFCSKRRRSRRRVVDTLSGSRARSHSADTAGTV